MVLCLTHKKGDLIDILFEDQNIGLITINLLSSKDDEVAFNYESLGGKGEVLDSKNYFLKFNDRAYPLNDLTQSLKDTNENLEIYVSNKKAFQENHIKLVYNASKKIKIIRKNAIKKF